MYHSRNLMDILPSWLEKRISTTLCNLRQRYGGKVPIWFDLPTAPALETKNKIETSKLDFVSDFSCASWLISGFPTRNVSKAYKFLKTELNCTCRWKRELGFSIKSDPAVLQFAGQLSRDLWTGSGTRFTILITPVQNSLFIHKNNLFIELNKSTNCFQRFLEQQFIHIDSKISLKIFEVRRLVTNN